MAFIQAFPTLAMKAKDVAVVVFLFSLVVNSHGSGKKQNMQKTLGDGCIANRC